MRLTRYLAFYQLSNPQFSLDAMLILGYPQKTIFQSFDESEKKPSWQVYYALTRLFVAIAAARYILIKLLQCYCITIRGKLIIVCIHCVFRFKQFSLGSCKIHVRVLQSCCWRYGVCSTYHYSCFIHFVSFSLRVSTKII